MNRTDAILSLVTKEIERQRGLLEAAKDARSVMLVVKLEGGNAHARAVILSVQCEKELTNHAGQW